MIEFTGMLPAILLTFIVVWEAFLIGMSMTYAGHAANEGARTAAVNGDYQDIKREALRRVSGAWADERNVEVYHQTARNHPDYGYVRVTIRPPLLFPGVLLPMEVSARSKVVYEGAE
jgi:hypothetical protein